MDVIVIHPMPVIPLSYRQMAFTQDLKNKILQILPLQHFWSAIQHQTYALNACFMHDHDKHIYVQILIYIYIYDNNF
jgi:hypothetical protein